MTTAQPSQEARFLQSLRQMVRKRVPAEACDLCATALGPQHDHLIEPQSRQLLCVCPACEILFTSQSGAKYKRVPRRIWRLNDFRMSDVQWESLLIPIQLAFFLRESVHETIHAIYPSPAGPTESLLPLNTWREIEAENPLLAGMETDVEALLVNRVGYARGTAPAEYYLLPVDQCYRLVGLIRAHWKGLSGGTEVWQEVGGFFDELNKKTAGNGGGIDA